MKKITLIVLTLILYSCSATDDSINPDNSDPVEDPDNPVVVTAMVNGNAFSVTMEEAIFNAEPIFFVGTRLTFLARKHSDSPLDIKVILIDIWFENSSEFAVGAEYDSTNLPPGTGVFIGEYQTSEEGTLVDASTENTIVPYLKITAIDEVNSLISGEFSFTAQDTENGQLYTYEITEGVFTDVEFNNDL